MRWKPACHLTTINSFVNFDLQVLIMTLQINGRRLIRPIGGLHSSSLGPRDSLHHVHSLPPVHWCALHSSTCMHCFYMPEHSHTAVAALEVKNG